MTASGIGGGVASGVAERWDAGRAVAGPAPVAVDGGHLDGLRAAVGPVLGTVDWAVRHLTGHDLLAELVEPVSGDVAALGVMRDGWGRAAVALDAVAGNHDGLGRQLPGVWEGGARRAAAGALDDLAGTAAHQAEAARLVAEQLGHLQEVSRVAAEVVCAVLAAIEEAVLGAVLRMAAGPVGAALNAAASPALVARVAALVRRARSAVERVVAVVDLCLEVVRRVKAAVDAVAVVSAGVVALQHGRAASRMDDTAAAYA
ncbi:hypothetical protein GCM10009737_25350 [Nocardioides lentus]|uniref:WXG100 family type VII secretion target n=1 Tax=Nocardioides lentus TaxID=338077 RepID=A0ABN2PIF8_9ACTN